jgi:hypothetical protein
MSKLIKHGEEWVHSETGQVFTKKELKAINDKQLHESHNQYLRNSIEHELDSQVKLIKVKEPKEPTKRTIKEGYTFNMIHRTDVKDFFDQYGDELTLQDISFIGMFSAYITYPNNDVKINKKYLTLEDLAKKCKLSKNKITSTIKNLERLEVIKVIKGGNVPPVIYFNPFLFASGREIANDTFLMFCKSKYNPEVARYQ